MNKKFSKLILDHNTRQSKQYNRNKQVQLKLFAIQITRWGFKNNISHIISYSEICMRGKEEKKSISIRCWGFLNRKQTLAPKVNNNPSLGLGFLLNWVLLRHISPKIPREYLY